MWRANRIPAVILVGVFLAGLARGADWPQLQNGPQRQGYSSESVSLPLSNTWAHGFREEHLFPQSQPIIAGGKVFIGTEHGTFYAYDSSNGDESWTYPAGGPILHTAGVEGTKVFFGCKDSCVYALNTSDGSLAWKFNAETDGTIVDRSGFSTAVLLAESKVFIVSRRGIYYALNQSDGSLAWYKDIGEGVLKSSAYESGRIFFGAMDMRCYALDSADGDILWTSGQLAGAAFKDYWPVCAGGKVLLRPLQVYGNDLPGIGMASYWVTGPLSGAAITVQQNQITYLEANPQRRNMFCLDQATGAETVVMHWTQCCMNGAVTSPCVDGDGKLIVPVSGKDNWRGCWGRLDLGLRYVTEFLCEDPLSNDGTGNKDENLCVSAAGRLVFVFHTQESNAQFTGAWNLDSRQWQQINPYSAEGFWWCNTQGGGTCPAAISNGRLYHTTQNTLNCRTLTIP
jgi:hypothetical protein